MTGDRKTDFENIATCWFIIFMLSGALVYFALNGKLEKQLGILGIVLIFALMLPGIWGLVSYRNKYFGEPYQRDIRLKQKDKHTDELFCQKMKGKTMYQVCRLYMLDYNITKSTVIGIMFGFMSLLYHLGGFPVNIDIRKCLIDFTVVSIIGGLLFYLYSLISENSVKQLKREIAMSGYDPQRISDDFAGGAKYQLIDGLLHIGANYVVLCHRKGSFVKEIREIKRVEKEIDCDKFSATMGQKVEIQGYYIVMYTDKSISRVKCMVEMDADRIVEEFALHGI